MKTKAIRLTDISIDGGTQQRDKIDKAIVDEYAEAMRCGAKFPPVTLFHDGAQFWLADGFHRYWASKAAEMLDILADVHDGLCRDAILFSAGANGTHGIRLTNADKRKAVMILLADKEWSAWTDSAIARHCKVTHPFVGKLRSETSSKTEVLPVTVTGAASKPATVLEVENQNPVEEIAKTESETGAPADYHPDQDRVSELTETIRTLDEENQLLKDAIAINAEPPEGQQAAAEIITELRAEIKTLTASLHAVSSTRNLLQTENTAMKKQLAMQRAEIKKLKGE